MREEAEPIWKQQRAHPFLTGLADGSLPQSKFLFYTRQDIIFLKELNRVFAYAASQTDRSDEIARFAELVIQTLGILENLNRRFVSSHGMDTTQLNVIRPTAVTYAFSNHLLVTALTGSYPAILAALLPSMWMYDELGTALAARGEPAEDHPYRDWLLTHAGPHLAHVTGWMRSRLDELAPVQHPLEQDRLREVFLISSRYEIAFWDMSWREEDWLDNER